MLANIANQAMSLAVTDHVFDLMHAKSMEVDLEYYENPQYFDTLHRAQQEGPYRPTAIVNDLARLVHNSVMLLAKKQSMADFLAPTSATVAVFGSFAYIAYKTVHGHITLGDMVMFFQAFQRGLNAMRDLLGGMASLYENNLFLSNLFDFLTLAPKVKQPKHPKPVPLPLQQGIVFDGVSFQYPSSTRRVLEDISLAIAPGETVALVGRNGCGKTTLAKLLCRLYDPQHGYIAFDGINLKEFDIKLLRRQISVLFQDSAKYYLTARENIWFGNVELGQDELPIKKAARQAGVDEFITELPGGYEAVLGKWFDNGEELSRGEWQKIAQARAFLRK